MTYYSKRNYKQQPGCRLWEATARCGQISVRNCRTTPVVALDVADIAAESKKKKEGVITAFYDDRRQAEGDAARMRQEGLYVELVDVRPYEGPVAS